MTHRCHVDGRSALAHGWNCRRSVGARHLVCRVSGIGGRGRGVHAIGLPDRSAQTGAPTSHTRTAGDD